MTPKEVKSLAFASSSAVQFVSHEPSLAGEQANKRAHFRMSSACSAEKSFQRKERNKAKRGPERTEINECNT